LKEDISAEERRFETPDVPMALEAGPRREGFDASGVLFLFPMILLAMVMSFAFFDSKTEGGCC
jgi:hypothetical protein